MTWKGIVGRGFTRAEFGEYVSTLQLTRWAPDFVVLHNTQDPTLAQWHEADGAIRMAGFAKYYAEEKGWSAGPHLFVADDLIWIFTPLTVAGVHSPSWNAVSWGVETVGDFDHEELEAEQLENLVEALRCLHRLAGWNRPQLRLHKDDPKTEHTFCPGVNFDRAVITARLAQALT